LILLVGVALGVSGGWQNKKAINTETTLVTQSDIEALEWIKTHTPEDARFFVNTTGWGYGVYRGVDGGGWILPITGRWSLAPTIFYPFGEDLLINETWIDWSFRASRVNACDVDFWELVQEAELNYLYMRQGTTGIQAQNLVTCDGLYKLYDNQEVSIWLIDSYNANMLSENNENK